MDKLEVYVPPHCPQRWGANDKIRSMKTKKFLVTGGVVGSILWLIFGNFKNAIRSIGLGISRLKGEKKAVS